MENTENSKPYDLEERTFLFARNVRRLIKKLSKNELVADDLRQVIRSSGSVGANYIEANEALGKKDFAMRIRISRKESKESNYWLRLLNDNEYDTEIHEEIQELAQEANELMKIFGAILQKTK